MSKFKFKDGIVIEASTKEVAIAIKKLRTNANLEQYQPTFLFKVMKETDNQELKEKIRKILESKKSSILTMAREYTLNSSWGKIAKELFGIKNAKDIDKIFESERKKVTAFYDYFEMEQKLNKLKGNITWFINAINATLKYLDSKKVLYAVDSDLTDNNAKYSFVVTNNKNEKRTFVVVLSGGFNNSKVEIKEVVNEQYKSLTRPFMTELKEFIKDAITASADNDIDELDYMLESIIGDIKYFHIYSDKVIDRIKKQYRNGLKSKLAKIKNAGGKWRVNCTKLFRQCFNEAAEKEGEKPQGLYYEKY